jgi:hypothetical protein
MMMHAIFDDSVPAHYCTACCKTILKSTRGGPSTVSVGSRDDQSLSFQYLAAPAVNLPAQPLL